MMIKIENLSFSYGNGKFIIEDLSLNVSKGNIYGFIGSNGAGKSTIIRCILGLLSPQKGNILVHGRNQPLERLEIIKQTGFLIEGPCFYANLTCHENLKLLQSYYNFNKNRIELVLKKVGLWTVRDHLYGKCSTGMKQRLGIAKSFLYNPDLIILDEPLNGLDPEWIVKTRMIIKDLNYSFGTTIFLSSHLLSEMELIATHIGLLRNGKLEYEGPVEQFLIKTQYTRMYITLDSIFDLDQMFLPKGISVEAQEENCFEFLIQDKLQLHNLLELLISKNIRILDIRTLHHGLENTYLENNKIYDAPKD